MKGLKFQKCSKESSVYRKEVGSKILILAIYVDDLFVTGNSLKIITELNESMSRQFEMSDLGRLMYYLGIEVKQSSKGIEIKQEAYAQRILVEAGMDTCNPTHIPMEFGLKLSKHLKKSRLMQLSIGEGLDA